MNDYLTLAERERLEQLRRHDGFARDVLQQTTRILASGPFARVQQRAKDFLGFVVAKTLLGESEQIKELTVAISVFEKSADFDPAESSMVRVAASELRQRLDDYARHAGRNDVLRITIPLNTYIPEIHDRRLILAIYPFENWHPHQGQPHICATLVDELAYQLERADVRVMRGVLDTITGSDASQFTLRGSVEAREDHVRVTFSLADALGGRIVVSQAVEGPRDGLLKLAREIGETLHGAIHDAYRHVRTCPTAVRKRK